ncbi:porphobilinogen deaminase isoform X3 [Lingula anatina]|uniref:hydroxymethylbilane synthase n=1 Tax=Lingula anatina TaxID=7574 RepID=A0A1S3I9L9_LINAN|nr:porphobilinogen deaminase isoform X3 [Lingula anatina]|eukprot:XP_013394551.1 porphobilinogen deaminase isoform X3 [Lingula anatina]
MGKDVKKVVRVGTRKSQLALIQTHHVIALLSELYPNIEFEVIKMSTTGDKVLDTALSKIGEKSLFTKELEFALEDKRVDFVVHSLKDLPSTLPPGMIIAGVLERESPCDAVVFHPDVKDKKLQSLPQDSIIGTSSLRRASQLKRQFPQLKFQDVRGNLNTRLRKLDTGDTYSALVLAEAGLKRMQWNDRIDEVLSPDVCMYAICQGALAVECRDNDTETLELISKLQHRESLLRCVAERAFLKKLEGGCSVPVAVHSELADDNLMLKGGVFSLDGTEAVIDSINVKLPEEGERSPKRSRSVFVPSCASVVSNQVSFHVMQAAEAAGIRVAELLLAEGAGPILEHSRQHTEAHTKRHPSGAPACPYFETVKKELETEGVIDKNDGHVIDHVPPRRPSAGDEIEGLPHCPYFEVVDNSEADATDAGSNGNGVVKETPVVIETPVVKETLVETKSNIQLKEAKTNGSAAKCPFHNVTDTK